MSTLGPRRWDSTVVRGSMDGDGFSVWYLDREHVAGVLAVDRSEDLERGRELFGQRVDPKRLANPAADPMAP